MSLCSPFLIETYREGAVCPSYACLYSGYATVFIKFIICYSFKSATEASECKAHVANEFQIEGPEVAKLRDPIDCVELSDRDGRQNGDAA